MKKIISLLFSIGVTFLANAQNIGIGTQAPGAKLHILSANDEAIRLDAGSPYLSLYSSGIYKGYFWKSPNSIEVGSATGSNLPITFAPNGVQLVYIGINGNLGIGTNSPLQKLHVEGNTFLNGNVGIGNNNPTAPLAFAASGGKKIILFPGGTGDAGFGIYGSELRIHSDYSGAAITFGYDDNILGFTERMRINGNGNVGIGTSAPGFPLNFADVTGDKISLYGSSGAHYGFGIQGFLMQIHSNDVSADIAFGYGSSSSFNETMRITGNGKVGIGTTAPAASLEVNGYSKLGSDAPSIKVIKVTGTTAATEGGYVEIAHGVNSLKILSFSVMVQGSTGIWVGSNVGVSAFNFFSYINTGTILVANKFGDSAAILSRPIKILISYEE